MHLDKVAEDGADRNSFVDALANLVGVLIILAMLAGMQRSGAPTGKQGSADANVVAIDAQELEQELAAATKEALSAQKHVLELAAQVASLGMEAKAHDRQRVQLAMHRKVIEDDLERRRSRLDAERKDEFDVQRKLLESKIKLDQLTQEHLTLAATPDDVETVECVPTPIAKETDKPSIHLRLRKGMVSIVPVEKLQQEFQAHAEGIRRRLQNSSEVVETFGPIDGYRAKLTVIRRRASGGPIAGQRQENSLDTFVEFLPISEDIGQNLEQALLPGSTLHEYLEAQRRESPPVDVWLYTDSFDAFRTLKRALWEKGFAVAVRPLPPGATIGASPYGSNSAAQ